MKEAEHALLVTQPKIFFFSGQREVSVPKD
jgi:hypothetical protein